MFLNALNFSYRDKDNIENDNGHGARTMKQSIYLLKLRFSPWERVEIAFVPGYVHNEPWPDAACSILVVIIPRPHQGSS